MNVFVCDVDPVIAAQSLADKHVVKMVVETAQMLSAACELSGITFEGQYRLTHRHHPCVQALLEQNTYVRWTVLHGLALCSEYTRRYDRRHKSQNIIETAASLLPWDTTADFDFEQFPRAVFDEFKGLNVVEAYRRHLAHKYNVLWKPGNARWRVPAVRPVWAT